MTYVRCGFCVGKFGVLMEFIGIIGQVGRLRFCTTSRYGDQRMHFRYKLKRCVIKL